MAARKKKKARAKKAAAPNLVVGSKVKEAVKATGYRCSGDLVDAVNVKVASMLEAAVERCASNNRGTVRPQDL
jgi:histone H3/H4